MMKHTKPVTVRKISFLELRLRFLGLSTKAAMEGDPLYDASLEDLLRVLTGWMKSGGELLLVHDQFRFPHVVYAQRIRFRQLVLGKEVLLDRCVGYTLSDCVGSVGPQNASFLDGSERLMEKALERQEGEDA